MQIIEDIKCYRADASKKSTVLAVTAPGFICLTLARFSIWLQTKKVPSPIYAFFETINIILFSCQISSKAQLGKRLTLPHPIGIVIGRGVEIGDDCTIYQNVTIGTSSKSKSEYPKLMNNVTIYSNSVIAGKITIESNSTIPALSFIKPQGPKTLRQ